MGAIGMTLKNIRIFSTALICPDKLTLRNWILSIILGSVIVFSKLLFSLKLDFQFRPKLKSCYFKSLFIMNFVFVIFRFAFKMAI